MRYYLIAGEASGDLHASHLMRALQEADPSAEFRFIGGDLMQAVGGQCVAHYKDLAYMGFVAVALHLRTILGNMSRCKRDIASWHPHVVILVDYPGFNLSIAKHVNAHHLAPICYYISPKIWAWKEYRIRNIRRDVHRLLSILPFEPAYFEQRHHCAVHYVGNPTADEVCDFRRTYAESREAFGRRNGLDARPIVALLAGSRKAEISANLPRMLRAVQCYPGWQAVVAGAPGIDPQLYARYIGESGARVVHGQTYALLSHAQAALVTSGTATLETALFGVPQAVCYYMRAGRLVSLLKRLVLSVKFVSLVNLIAGREVVRELVAGDMTPQALYQELGRLLTDETYCGAMLNGYEEVAQRLGPYGAATRAAKEVIDLRGDSATDRARPFIPNC